MQNFMNTLRPVNSVSHPLVAEMYLKKEYKDHEQNVLVIEARGMERYQENETEHDGYDSYLIDLLLDLEELKTQAEEEIGTFDRIDIRRA